MGLRFDRPETVRAAISEVIATHARVTLLSMDLARPTRPRIEIEWSMGTEDARGDFTPLASNSYQLKGAEVLAFLSTIVVAGNTWQQEFDTGIFNYLIAQGLIPRGTAT